MKMKWYGNASLAAVAFLLMGTVAMAQNTAAHPRKAAGSTPVGSQQTGAKSMGSAHATESLSTTKGTGTNASGQNSKTTAPYFKNNENSGSMPQSGVKAATVRKRKPGGSATTQYKDPEDMTTRYRPGNNKTTKAGSAKPQSNSVKPPH